MTRSVQDTDMYYYPFQISGVKKQGPKGDGKFLPLFCCLVFWGDRR